MAKCNNHHQNDFELERNNSKRFTRRFFSNNQKWDRNKLILRHFPTHGRLILNVQYKVDKTPFRMDIVTLMAKCNNHHQNDLELERNNPKRFTRRFSSNNQKWGRNKLILRHFPTHAAMAEAFLKCGGPKPMTRFSSSTTKGGSGVAKNLKRGRDNFHIFSSAFFSAELI